MAHIYMSNAAHYTFFGHSSFRQRELVMLITGITGFAILAALLQVFLLPNASAQSSNPSDGTNYTSPGVYPARILKSYRRLII